MTASATSKPQVVVSLTSFPQAIPYAVGAIRSILNGSVLPHRLVLYLTFSQFGDGVCPRSSSALAARTRYLKSGTTTATFAPTAS